MIKVYKYGGGPEPNIQTAVMYFDKNNELCAEDYFWVDKIDKELELSNGYKKTDNGFGYYGFRNGKYYKYITSSGRMRFMKNDSRWFGQQKSFDFLVGREKTNKFMDQLIKSEIDKLENIA